MIRPGSPEDTSGHVVNLQHFSTHDGPGDDVIDAFLIAALDPRADGQVYNLGSAELPISLNDLAQLLIATNAAGDYRRIPFPPDRKSIDIGDYYADFSKIQRELGWTPQVPLAEGLRRSLDYFRQHLPLYL